MSSDDNMNAFKSPICKMRKCAYVGDVTALQLLPCQCPEQPQLLLAGVGAQLQCYDTMSGDLLLMQSLLEGCRIHGIQVRRIAPEGSSKHRDSVARYLIAVYGDRKIKVCSLVVEKQSNKWQARLEGGTCLGPFWHWVLDARLLYEDQCALRSSDPDASPERYSLLAVGLTDNTVDVWNWQCRALSYRVECTDRCLLYSMALLGDSPAQLKVAAGTIFDGVLLYRARPAASSPDPTGAHFSRPAHRLLGHQGSVHRVVWGEGGDWLGSCSDDRTARVWDARTAWRDATEEEEAEEAEGSTREITSIQATAVLYGHSSRLWDCCVLPDRQVAITASEDCTCRVWRFDGQCLATLKGHRGRGVWRCVYDPASHLLMSGGADASIKIFSLGAHLPPELDPCGLPSETKSVAESAGSALPQRGISEREFCIVPPWSEAGAPKQGQDSKAEYVRVVHVATPQVMYVGTNRGLVHRALLPGAASDTGPLAPPSPWQLLWTSPRGAALMCMAVPSDIPASACQPLEGEAVRRRRMALGDGAGRVTVLLVEEPAVGEAEREGDVASASVWADWTAHDGRRVLGVFWADTPGACDDEDVQQRLRRNQHLLTTDPEGEVRVWHIPEFEHASPSNAELLATFRTPFKSRVLAVDLDWERGVLICGDQTGNVLIFQVPSVLDAPHTANLLDAPRTTSVLPSDVAARAHGNAAVQFVRIGRNPKSPVMTCQSAGRDACIHNYEVTMSSETKTLVRVGTQRVASITAVEMAQTTCAGEHVVAGFQANDFLIWSISHQCELLRVACGGWKRAHSCLLGATPSTSATFVYVKDGVLHGVGGLRSLEDHDSQERSNTHARSLHMCHHGRETNCVCWVPGMPLKGDAEGTMGPLALMSGAEDGSLIKLLYRQDNKSAGLQRFHRSHLVGEHAAGTSVRDITLARAASPAASSSPPWRVLVSVGAKEVAMIWLVRWKYADASSSLASTCSGESCSWDVDVREMSARARAANEGHVTRRHAAAASEPLGSMQTDQRYIAVKAFFVGSPAEEGDGDSSSLVVFVVVSGSDVSLELHAFVAASNRWYTLACLQHHRSPVLSLDIQVEGDISGTGHASVLLFSGSTDACIAVWNLTAVVQGFLVSGCRHKCLSVPDTAAVPTTEALIPRLVLSGAHQSGVNALSVSPAPTALKCALGLQHEMQVYVVASGGDDQAVHLAMVRMDQASGPDTGETTTKELSVRDIRAGNVLLAHLSSVKGIWTNGHHIVSTGLDQCLRVWKIRVSGSGSDESPGHAVSLRQISSTVLEVAEPSALDVDCNERSTAKCSIVVTGRGLQVVECEFGVETETSVPESCA